LFSPPLHDALPFFYQPDSHIIYIEKKVCDRQTADAWCEVLIFFCFLYLDKAQGHKQVKKKRRRRAKKAVLLRFR